MGDYSFSDVTLTCAGLDFGATLEGCTVEMLDSDGVRMREWQCYRVSEAEFTCLVELERCHGLRVGDVVLINENKFEVKEEPVFAPPAFVGLDPPAQETEVDRIARITREMCGG